MVIIWRGAGILVPVVALGCLVLVQLGVGYTLGDPNYYQRHSWLGLVGLMIAAVIVWFLGARLNRRTTDVAFDPRTGQRVPPRSAHTLFFVPMQYWALILAAAGVIFAFVRK